MDRKSGGRPNGRASKEAVSEVRRELRVAQWGKCSRGRKRSILSNAAKKWKRWLPSNSCGNEKVINDFKKSSFGGLMVKKAFGLDQRESERRWK